MIDLAPLFRRRTLFKETLTLMLAWGIVAYNKGYNTQSLTVG